jgi:phosphoenolpyruvate carboxykinase (GTP)
MIPNPPKIFHVNWFRTDNDGNFIWPGFGDNLRVLHWILERCEDKVDAVETAIGFVPKAEDINIEGLDISIDTIRELLSVDKEHWLEDLDSIKQFYAKIGDTIPAELKEELAKLEANLTK